MTTITSVRTALNTVSPGTRETRSWDEQWRIVRGAAVDAGLKGDALAGLQAYILNEEGAVWDDAARDAGQGWRPTAAWQQGNDLGRAILPAMVNTGWTRPA